MVHVSEKKCMFNEDSFLKYIFAGSLYILIFVKLRLKQACQIQPHTSCHSHLHLAVNCIILITLADAVADCDTSLVPRPQCIRLTTSCFLRYTGHVSTVYVWRSLHHVKLPLQAHVKMQQESLQGLHKEKQEALDTVL